VGNAVDFMFTRAAWQEFYKTFLARIGFADWRTCNLRGLCYITGKSITIGAPNLLADAFQEIP
jgi:hypothetical protein